MDIVFVWIDKFRNLEKAGFNLGSEYNYELELDEINRACKLTSSRNENFIPDFFKPFLNISAIVGENASGKSSFIDALRQILHGRRDYFEYVIIYKKGENEFYFNYFLGYEERVRFENTPMERMEDVDIEFNVLPDGFKLSKYEKRNHETIFFSQIIDLNIYPINHDNQLGIDISSNWLSYKDVETQKQLELPYSPLGYHK